MYINYRKLSSKSLHPFYWLWLLQNHVLITNTIGKKSSKAPFPQVNFMIGVQTLSNYNTIQMLVLKAKTQFKNIERIWKLLKF